MLPGKGGREAWWGADTFCRPRSGDGTASTHLTRGHLLDRVVAKCFIDEMIMAVSLARQQQAHGILIKIQDFREIFFLD